ncbi:phasin family protein [Rhodoferax sp. PAMC 29310]|uniref:phasin family protein n=1 Tax=Rhodoferax sp. PAMC 29310 TaxID=2822760 RepID=UPI001B326149|nr:phasin family protein [Rhodoferax sp. PAMC 29310]
MVKKLEKKTTTAKKTNAPLTGSVKDSAQQIWQAGLGAFSRAQAEGTKAFDVLVKEGVSLQRKTQSAAEERISDATNKMTSMASGITNKATGQWDKLESIFEERVAKALNKLGVPSSKDVAALIERIEDLNKSVQKLSHKPVAKVATPTPVKAPAKAAAKKPVKAAPKTAAKAPVRAAAKPAAKRAPARKSVKAVVAPASASNEPAAT